MSLHNHSLFFSSPKERLYGCGSTKEISEIKERFLIQRAFYIQTVFFVDDIICAFLQSFRFPSTKSSTASHQGSTTHTSSFITAYFQFTNREKYTQLNLQSTFWKMLLDSSKCNLVCVFINKCVIVGLHFYFYISCICWKILCWYMYDCNLSESVRLVCFWRHFLHLVDFITCHLPP